tara:strand:- start:600 stop:833 length:234 start_codon:yes stop_codon:yes gene_type:complete
MKTLLISIVSLVLGFASFNASATTQIISNGAGGYIAYHSGGGTTQINSNGAGGYIAYRSGGGTTQIHRSGNGFIIYD